MAIFLNIKRAFNAVSRVHELHSLNELKIHGRFFFRVADFLSSRKICNDTPGEPSQEHMLYYGIPQERTESYTLQHRHGAAARCFVYLIAGLDICRPMEFEFRHLVAHHR